MNLTFSQRSELSQYEWDPQKKHWNRPEIDRALLKTLSERSSVNGIVRLTYFFSLLAVSLLATLYIQQFSLLLAIPTLYIYYFLYGFLVAIAHEFQPRTVFAKSLDWPGEIIFPIVPSGNLPKLHQKMLDYVPEQISMIACWKEMFAIAKEKDQHPESEYVPLAG